MNLGERLTNLRKEKGLSQEELADKLNVTRQTISKWETNQSTPDFDKIVPICTLFDITFDELVTGKKSDSVRSLENKSNDNTQKRAIGIGFGTLLIIIAVAWLMTSVTVMNINPIVATAIFMVIVGFAVFVYIYTGIMYKKEETKEEVKQKELYKRIDGVLSLVFLIIYLGISFITFAWHITWIIWIIYALVAEIIKLILTLKGDTNEK